MSATWLIINFIIAFVGIAVVIVRFKLNPAISLLIGTLYLGITSGVDLMTVVNGVNEGFGGLMMEVGLLISLGIMMGYLMSTYGAVQRIVEAILKVFGKKGSPYAFAVTLSTVTPAIYFDVLLVLVSPIAKRIARTTGRPIASIAGPVSMGLAAGNALMIPGAAMLAYIGVLQVTAGEMLVPALAITLPAVLITTFLYVFLIERARWWRADDEQDHELTVDDAATAEESESKVSLLAALAPIGIVLVMIIAGILAPVFNYESSIVSFLSSPIIAMLAGVIVALVITVAKHGLSKQEETIDRALETAGTILVVTAVAGSLGQIIAETGMREVLGGLLEANRALPLLAVWFIAAVMRMAIGGQTVSGITAISIIAPLIGDLGLSPILVIMAAGAGGAFGGQFSDNAFWMARSLFGLSTKGTLKTYTLAQSLLSIVVLAIVVLADIFV